MKKGKVTLGVNLIGVRDLKRARPFYEKIIGMHFIEFRPPFAEATLGKALFNIEEDAQYREKEWAKKNIGGRKSCVFDVKDMDYFLKRATKAGARIIEQPKLQPWGWINAVITDLDGNEFCIEQEA
jgi:predicted enzyme related to lactoylglutathione lyase